MNDQYHDREQEIFLACLREPDPNARAELLARQCGDDTALREAVELLLRSQEDASAFLEAPFELTEAPTTATMSTAELDAMVGATIGPYKLREKLGEGGMGVVFVAEQKHPVRRKVAIKVVKPGLDSKEVIARFEAERQALALMDHPNIAKVLDAGVTETGRPYFAMDLVQGLAITKYCEKRRLGIRARLKLFGQVCRAVQHAHQKGIIHRDLKPSNVLVAEIDGVAVPKVIDFGVAKAVGQKLTDQSVYTQFWQLIGTPLYMSPEQAGFGVIDVDTRSDVYSLGVLLYELLSGTTPLEKQVLKELGYDELRRRIREEDPPRPSVRLSLLDAEHSSTIADSLGVDQREHSRLLRGELDWIVMRALEKDRSRRYESPSAFAADIDRYLNDEPVEACPPSRWYQLRKLASRHKSALSTVAVVLIALLTATGVSLWQAKEANEARKLADQRLAQADTNYQHALNAVEQMLQRVGSHELATTPKMLAVQKELLENAVTFYEQLIEENPTDPQVKFLASQACNSMHHIVDKMPDQAEDQTYCLKAVELAKQALTIAPSNEEYANQLAYSHFILAHTHASQDRAYAEAVYREGLKVASAIPESYLQHNRTESMLAFGLANLLTDSQPKEAEKHFKRAIFASEKNHEDTETIGKTYKAYAYALSKWKQYPEAEHKFKQAIQYLTQSIKDSPNTIRSKNSRYQLLLTHINLGRTYTRANRPREAEEQFRIACRLGNQLIEDFPEVKQYRAATTESFLQLHQSLIDNGRKEDLISLLDDIEKSLANDPSNGIFHYLIARLQQKLGQEESAVASFRKAFDLVDSLTNGQRISLMDDLIKTRQHDQVVRLTTRIMEDRPESWIYKRRGVSNFYLDHFDQALQDLTTAVELDPQDGSTLTWIPLNDVATCGNSQFQNGLIDLADKFIERGVNTSLPRFTRMILRTALGSADPNPDDLAVLVPASRDWGYYNQYLVALLAINVKDLESYRAICLQMLEDSPKTQENIDLHFFAWTCSLMPSAMDDFDAAIQSSRQAIASDSDDVRYVTGLGAVLFRAGRFAEAKRHLERAIEVSADENTSSSYSHYFLALTEHHLGNSEAAEEQLRIATEATEKELAETALWNRKLTLELLREEAVTLIRGNAAVEATEQAAL